MQVNSINNTSFGRIYISDNNNVRNRLIKEIMKSNASADVYKQALIDIIATEKDDDMFLMVRNKEGELKMDLFDKSKGIAQTYYGPNRFLALLKAMRSDSVKGLIANIRNGIEV